MKRNYFLVSTIFLIGMVGASLGAAQSQEVEQLPPPPGKDYYKMIPKDEHKEEFPHGHSHEGKEGRKCYFNNENSTYFCQFDWDKILP